MRRTSLLSRSWILVAVLFGWACDAVPGAKELDQSAPVLSNLFFSPEIILLDNLPPGSIIDGIARFPVDVTVDVEDRDGDVERIYVLVQSPVSQSDPIALKQVDVPGDGRVEVRLDLDIEAAAVGVYSVRVYASDRLGNLGNQVIGSLVVDASGEPPVIDAIDVPTTITRPAPGQPPIEVPIVAHVSDPDGLANILRVETQFNGAATFRLCDDGGVGSCNTDFPLSGDVTAGDGLFTLTIAILSSDTAGIYELAFKAIDRAGLESETVNRTITVE